MKLWDFSQLYYKKDQMKVCVKNHSKAELPAGSFKRSTKLTNHFFFNLSIIHTMLHWFQVYNLVI